MRFRPDPAGPCRALATALRLLMAALITSACSPREEGEPLPKLEATPTAERLAELGYADTVDRDPAPALSGVTRHDPSRAWRGVNVYCSVRSTDVHFVDMDGTVLHTLRLPDDFDPEEAKRIGLGILPDGSPLRRLGEELPPSLGADCMAEPDGDGHLLVLSSPYLGSLDLSGDLRWIDDGHHHHDFSRDRDGAILSWTERAGALPVAGQPVAIRDHALQRLRPGAGEARDLFTTSALLGDWQDAAREIIGRELRKEAHGGEPVLPADPYHPNSVELLPRDVPVAGGTARRGDALIAVRNLDLVAIVDLEEPSVVWSWGPGELDWPHHPSLLANGHVLVFDNGFRRRYSRLVEVDPATGEIVWEYRADPAEDFHSNVRGAAQPLPNGNILVTESTRGRVFEIDRRGNVVWQFRNPERLEETDERRQIYRMFRISPAAWERLQQGANAPRPAPSTPD